MNLWMPAQHELVNVPIRILRNMWMKTHNYGPTENKLYKAKEKKAD